MSFKIFLYFLLISSIYSACSPTNEELFDKANKLSDQRKYDEAIKIYTQIISRNNRLQLAYYNRGGNYLLKKSYKDALADFNRVLSLQTIGDYRIEYSKNYPIADDVAKAQVPYNDALYKRAIVKYYMDSIKSSFIDFQTLVNDNYDSKSNCTSWQGTIWVKTGNLKKACEYFHKAKQFANTA